MITVFCILATVVFIGLTFMWSSNSYINMAIKAVLFLMGLFAVVCTLASAGFIVKV